MRAKPVFRFYSARTLLMTGSTLAAITTLACRANPTDAAAGTGSDSSAATRPDKIAIISGDSQTRPINRRLLYGLNVQVTASDGSPLPGVALDWVVTNGAGSISEQDQPTNSNGIGSALWTLGPQV